MGKRPEVVPLSEEEQKLVSEVLNIICIRMKQSWSGPRQGVCSESFGSNRSQNCHSPSRLPSCPGEDLEHEGEISVVIFHGFHGFFFLSASQR